MLPLINGLSYHFDITLIRTVLKFRFERAFVEGSSSNRVQMSAESFQKPVKYLSSSIIIA